MTQRVYTEKQIREAVDIAIGDDGFRSKEVIEILKSHKNKPKPEYDVCSSIISSIGYSGEE